MSANVQMAPFQPAFQATVQNIMAFKQNVTRWHLGMLFDISYGWINSLPPAHQLAAPIQRISLEVQSYEPRIKNSVSRSSSQWRQGGMLQTLHAPFSTASCGKSSICTTFYLSGMYSFLRKKYWLTINLPKNSLCE